MPGKNIEKYLLDTGSLEETPNGFSVDYSFFSRQKLSDLNMKKHLGCSKDFFMSSIQVVNFKYLNARFECNDIIIFVYSHYLLDPNAKSSDTKGNTFSIR